MVRFFIPPLISPLIEHVQHNFESCNALLPETFGALQVLKSAYRQGHISPAITHSGRARRSLCLLSDRFRLVFYLVQYSCDFLK